MGAVLVTGVAGFIGSTVALALVDAGHHVVGVDAMRPSYAPEVKQDNLRALLAHRRFAFHERDLAHDDVSDLVGQVGAVSHHAGRAGLRDSWSGDFSRYLEDNVAATQRLLVALGGAPQVRRVIVASSSSVYGDAESYPTREDARPQPLSPYGVSKLAAEHLAVAHAAAHGIPVVCLRYFSVFGPGQRPDMAFHRMIDAATGGEAFPLLGSGEQVRDYTYVGDVAEANLACLDAELAPGSVLNIAGGTLATVREALDVVGEITGLPVPVKRRPSAFGEAGRTAGDTTAARSLLGWRPRTGLRDGLAAQYERFLAQRARLTRG